MSRHRFTICIAFLGFAAWIALACGSSRKLQSITVSAASADAQDYPSGEVPFVATGHYNAAPMSVTPLPAGWGAASTNQVIGPPTDSVSVNANGVAQCNAGASGTYSVAAWVNVPYSGPPIFCPASLYGDSCSSVVGTAQLTCP
ncbi:MAG: hypothetical protein WAL89_17500 [Candidatus Sulfotelmatobacter sp.]|jgi:hypothetical protein